MKPVKPVPVDRLKLLKNDGRAAQGFRDDLRAARSQVLADAEGFLVVVAAIERLGKWLNPTGENMGSHERMLIALVTITGVGDADVFSKDLCVLRESRNDASHGGAAARHAASEALRVSIVLEGALTVLHPARWGDVTAEQVMTRNPVVAEPWQLIAEVRRVMLTCGFTALPYRSLRESRWTVITDEELAGWLNEGHENRKQRLESEVHRAVAAGLKCTGATPVLRDEKIAALCMRRGLRLVVDTKDIGGNLLGVIAPSDLL